MKKIIVALVAVFAMNAAASAQDAFVLSSENNNVTLSKIDFSTISKDAAMSTMQIGEVNMADLKDVSFPTEMGALSTVTLDNTKGGDRVVGAILAIFLGDFGIHHFYTGDTKDGILHLVFFWTGIPGLIGFIEGIIWLVDEGSYPKALIDML